MFKLLAFLAALIFVSAEAFPQRVITNVLPNDLDYRCAETNPGMAKRKLTVRQAYRGSSCSQDSSRLIEEATYDTAGRLIKLLILQNTWGRTVNWEASYKKLSDSTYESVARYRLGAEVPWDVLPDTTINNKQQIVQLYKVNKDSTINVRSVYLVNSQAEIVNVKRYDANNKLVLIFYPGGGDEAPAKTYSTVKIIGFDSIVTNRFIFAGGDSSENELIFNKAGKVKQTTQLYRGPDTDWFQRQYTIYDSRRRIVMILKVDRENEFVAQSRYYYGDSTLIRYTLDNNLTDSFVNEDRVFNADEQLILSRTLNSSQQIYFSCHHEYDDRKLPIKKKHYAGDSMLYCEHYRYR
jgi:hypothetical protein